MAFKEINACLIVDEENSNRIVEALHLFIDSLAVRERIPIFDSEITCTTVSDAENADEVRQETEEP